MRWENDERVNMKWKMESKELSHICHLNIRFWSQLRINRFERKQTINGKRKGIRICTGNDYVYDSFTYSEWRELFGCIILSLTKINGLQTFQGTISIVVVDLKCWKWNDQFRMFYFSLHSLILERRSKRKQ